MRQPQLRAPAPVQLPAPASVLLAWSNPTKSGLDDWDPPARLQQLRSALSGPRWLVRHPDGDGVQTSRDTLEKALGQRHDVLHVIAHGTRSRDLYLTDPESGLAKRLARDDLAGWCKPAGLQLVFLQVCRGGQAGSADDVGGVAERLLQESGASAVVASPALLDPVGSTSVAKAFYENLGRGLSLPEALDRGVGPLEDLSWALLELWCQVPVVPAAPEVQAQVLPAEEPGLSPRLQLAEALIDDWKELAETLDISRLDQKKFDRGREVQDTLFWLKARGRLNLEVLGAALQKIGRGNLLPLAGRVLDEQSGGL